LDDNVFNDLFEIELPKYKDKLESIFGRVSLGVVNLNTTFGHLFNNLQNYPIIIIFIVDMGQCVSPLANCKSFSASTFGFGSVGGYAFISVSTLEDIKNVV
jgi:hypothetical protein